MLVAFTLVAFIRAVAFVCAGGIRTGGIHTSGIYAVVITAAHLSYTVSNKTVAMFAMFDFLCLFLHNLSLKISEIFQEATHASCLHVCHVSWNSMEI